MENRRPQTAGSSGRKSHGGRSRAGGVYRGTKNSARQGSDKRFDGSGEAQNFDVKKRFKKSGDKFYSKNTLKPVAGKRFAAGKDSAKRWQQTNKIKITSELQITDGKHRAKLLQTTDSPKAQRTARQLRETVFKIINRRVNARRFLDLCAGSGIMGLEAISRGAMLGTFVERSPKMCSFIKKNLELCGIKNGHGVVVKMEAAPFLKQIGKRRRFWDVIYCDPPYDSNYDEILKHFEFGTAIAPGGLLLIEHHSEMFFPEKLGPLKRQRVLVQGETALSFYERK